MSVSETEARRSSPRSAPRPAMLSDDERAALDRDGYVVLDGVLDAAASPRCGRRSTSSSTLARRDPTRKHGGTLHLDDVLDSGPAFDGVDVAAAARRRRARSRRRLPRLRRGVPRAAAGLRRAGVHADDVPLAAGDPYRVVTTSFRWSASRSQRRDTRRPRLAPRSAARCIDRSPGRPHPRERLVTAPAGAAIVFNGHLWHSGTKNAS